MSKSSQVFAIKTTPNTILDDYAKLMHLADYNKYYLKNQKIIVKLNLSWSKFFPACSSPPWQIEGVLKTMIDDGYSPKNIFTAENETVVTNIERGLSANKWAPILKKYGVWFVPLTKIPFVPYSSVRSKFLTLKNKELHVLDKKVFPKGFSIPNIYINKPIIHLPTMKTHGHTSFTSAMKNAFGGLLTKRRHYSHQFMSEVLVDLLIIQKQIHPNIMSVVDGTVCGDGAGPRTMIPRIKNYLLAGYDQVAMDTVVARMLGFEPLELPAIKLAHEDGLGCGDFDQIEIIGEDVSNINWHFKVKRSLVIWGDQMVRKGPLSFLNPLMHNRLFMVGPILGSKIYHDFFWYPTVGQRIVNQFMNTSWGKVFQNYPDGDPQTLNKY